MGVSGSASQQARQVDSVCSGMVTITSVSASVHTLGFSFGVFLPCMEPSWTMLLDLLEIGIFPPGWIWVSTLCVTLLPVRTMPCRWKPPQCTSFVTMRTDNTGTRPLPVKQLCSSSNKNKHDQSDDAHDPIHISRQHCHMSLTAPHDD